MVRSRVFSFFALFLLTRIQNAAASTWKGKFDKVWEDGIDWNPFDDDEEDCHPLEEVALPILGSALTAAYGMALVLFGHEHARSQLHLLSIFRATGQDKLELAVDKMRRNFRDTKFALVRGAPSLLLAYRSGTKLDDRLAFHRRKVQETKDALEDGVMTLREARSISRMEKRQIRNLKRDMKRMVNAGTTLRNVWEALDLDEIMDVARGFAFQLLAVMATENCDNEGSLVSRWCLFLNLGGLLQSINNKMVQPGKTQTIGNVVSFASSGLLVTCKRGWARRGNTSLMSSAITVWGLKRFAKKLLLWDNDGPWNGMVKALDTSTGGILLIGLAFTNLIFQGGAGKVEEKATGDGKNCKLKCPEWIRKPLYWLDQVVQRLVKVVDVVV